MTTFNCPGTTRRWQALPDGRIDIEGLGVVRRPWPKDVDQWRSLIEQSASKYGLPPSWVAAIMALETGGRPGLCAKVGGVCSTAEGAGLMAMLQSTASLVAGRGVANGELLSNHALAIDLGAKFIASIAKSQGGDFVKTAVVYNAGSIRCATAGSGKTWVGAPPQEVCPPTPWGVIMGCVRSTQRANQLCAPSTAVPGQWACPNNYPEVAVQMLNAAIENGWATSIGASAAGLFSPGLVALGLGALAGVYAAQKLLPRWLG